MIDQEFSAKGSGLRSIFRYILLATVLLAGCDDRGLVAIQVDNVAARVVLATTPEARQTGLMHRQQMDWDEGLLMVFPRDELIAIWMRNTLIPLDVGFFDREGRLLNWISMQTDGGRAIHRSRGLARYALEMNLGWFKQQGIDAGARLRLPYAIEAN